MGRQMADIGTRLGNKHSVEKLQHRMEFHQIPEAFRKYGVLCRVQHNRRGLLGSVRVVWVCAVQVPLSQRVVYRRRLDDYLAACGDVDSPFLGPTYNFYRALC